MIISFVKRLSSLLEPTQDLYLNSADINRTIISNTLEPTQDLYLNTVMLIFVLFVVVLEPTQDLYLNFDVIALINEVKARTDTRFVFKLGLG